MVRRLLLVLAFVGILASSAAAFAQQGAGKSYCYRIQLRLMGNVVVPQQTICVPCPSLACPTSAAAPKSSIVEL